MGHILVAGVTNVEVSVPVEGFPVTYAPVRYPRHAVASRVAGVGFNVAAALAALGSPVRLATFAADDAPGAVVRAALHSRGLWGPLVADCTATPQSVVLYDADGRRMVSTDLKDLPDATYPIERLDQALDGADLAVITNIGFCRPLLRRARQRGVPVVTDVQAIAELDDPHNAEFMAAASILFCSDERLPHAPSDWARQLRRRYGCDVVVVGMGERGALLATRQPGAVIHVPAHVPDRVASTVGAGDALLAAFVHAFQPSGDALGAIRRAVIFAGCKVAAPPGTDGFLSGTELEDRYRQEPTRGH